MLGRTFLDQAHPLEPSAVAREAGPDLIEQPPVDFIDDFKEPRLQDLEPGDRPLLQRFGEKGVVRVCQGPLCDLPRLVPSEVCLVEKNAHQLRNRHRRVCIVELNGNLLREPAPIGVAKAEASHEIGQRAGHEKVLLHKAQALTHARGVVGIQYSRERFGPERLCQGTHEIAAAEFLKVEVIVCRRSPQPERIDGLPTVAHYGTIEGDADQAGRLTDHRAQCPCAELQRAVELYFDRLVRARYFPGVRAPEPVVREFTLPAVLKGLFEDPVFVPQSIAHGRDLHRGHGVKEASRQAPQPSVAETRVGLLLKKLVPVEVMSMDHVVYGRVEEKVGNVVGQRSAEEKLHREIVDALAILTLIGLLRTQPSLREHVAHGTRCGLETLASTDGRQFPDVIEEEVAFVQRIGRSGEPDGAATVLVYEPPQIHRFLESGR